MAFATAAHAQGTMDFSGAQTLMGTFKTVRDSGYSLFGFKQIAPQADHLD